MHILYLLPSGPAPGSLRRASHTSHERELYREQLVYCPCEASPSAIVPMFTSGWPNCALEIRWGSGGRDYNQGELVASPEPIIRRQHARVEGWTEIVLSTTWPSTAAILIDSRNIDFPASFLKTRSRT
jgi:hypothetical protein